MIVFAGIVWKIAMRIQMDAVIHAARIRMNVNRYASVHLGGITIIIILKEKIMLRLVSADAVKEIICKYEQRTIQRTMVYEVEKMPGVSATNEQMVEILGTDDVELD